MASMEAKTRAFLESQGHAWPAAPDPLLLLDGPMRRCSEALGRIAAHPAYFHEVPQVAILPAEVDKLKGITKTFAAMEKRPGNLANRSILIFQATSRLTGEVVHVRAIIERPKKDAWKFCVDWQKCFGYEWPKVDEYVYRPWYLAAYDTSFQAQWLLPGGGQMRNLWTAAAKSLLHTYPNPELIAPLKETTVVPQEVPYAQVTRPWEQYREQLADFVPPQLLDLSCRLGRSALTRNWSCGMVGSVVLTWRDVEQRHGMRGAFCYVLNDKPMWRDLEMITVYDFCLGDKLRFHMEPVREQYRILLDRTPDTALLVRWHEEHGQIWPEPVSALPEVVEDMLNEYESIAAMWEMCYGKVVARGFDSVVAKNTERIEKMGAPWGQITAANARRDTSRF
jgi:hypothetical protein